MDYDVDFNSKVDMTKNKMDAEEAVKAFASGRGALSQVKEDENGNKRFFNVYGDVHDGVDHILNIYMDSAVFNNLLMAIGHQNLKTPEKTDNKKEFRATQVTIDYIDEALMWVFYSDEEKIRIEAYTRDERKGFYAPSLEGEWKKTNGSLNITAEMFKEDDKLYYVFAFASLRNHLIAEGVVDQLRKLNKYSAAGVLITAVDEDRIAYKIVQDRQRPDLVCSMLFMGEITCRPYLDEMIKGNQVSKMNIEEKIKAAEEGEIWAMEALANAYLNGDEVDQDFEESFKWRKRIAETGDATAQFNVGLHLAKGAGTKRDFKEAAEWMRKAAENGDTDAADLVKIYEEAEENLRKAEAGDAAAQAEIAKLYTKLGGSLEQFNTDNDYDEAFKWAKKSADQGNPEGLYCLALCYEHGRGVEENIDKAIDAYQKGAEAGHDGCQYNLGCHYMTGNGVEKDRHKAFKLIKTAAENGNGLAMRELGRCYQFARGTAGNMKTAVEWYEKALEVIDDPELAQKTAVFKDMAEWDPSFDEEYPEDESDDGEDVRIEDATDLIRKGLEKSGKPYDDESVENLSVDEAYEALAAGMDDSSDDDEEERKAREKAEEERITKEEKSRRREEAERQKKEEQEKRQQRGDKRKETERKNAFDDKLSFDLPRKYELIQDKDEDGKPAYKIVYNITFDENGNRQAEKTFSITKYQKEKKTLVGNLESNFTVSVGGFYKDFNLGLSVSSTGLGYGRKSQITYKVYTGVAIIDYVNQWYAISYVHVGTDDYESKSEAASDIAAELTTVLGFVVIEGERLKAKPVSKSFIFNELKTESLNLQTQSGAQNNEASNSDHILKTQEKNSRDNRKSDGKRTENNHESEAREKEKAIKQEEARRREEAERQKKEEQEKKKQEENKRNNEVRKRVDQKKKLIMTFANDVCPILLNNNQMIIQEQESEMNAAKTTLESLGFFKRRQKQEQRAIIETCQRNIDKARTANVNLDVIRIIGEKLAEKLAEEDREYQVALVDQLMPEKNRASASKPVLLTSLQKENEEAKALIIDILKRSQRPMTVEEIAKSNSSLSNYTYQRIIHVLGDLKTDGLARSDRNSNSHKIVYTIIDKPDFDLNLPTYDVMDIDLDDSEDVKKAVKMDLDFILRQWEYDSRERLGTYAQDINQNDIVDTSQMRMDILRFYKQHEGQNLQTLKSAAGESLKDNMGDIIVIASACENDLVEKKYLEPFSRKKGIVTSSITDKGKLLLAMYEYFYGK